MTVRSGTCRIVALLAMIGSAAAADLAPAKPEPVAAPARADWVLQISPYMWASGLRGDVSPFRLAPTVGVKKSFGDVLDDLNFGGFLHVWHRNGRIVASADAMLVDTTESHAIERVPIFGPVRGLSADLDSRQITATLQAGYRLVETPSFSLDMLGGARLWSVANRITVSYGPFALSHRESFGWVDPVVGLRAFYGLTERLSLQAQADIGGFGLGSDLTWQLLATLNYTLTDHLSASLGYKVLRADYKSGGHVFDTTLQGPVAGLTYRF